MMRYITLLKNRFVVVAAILSAMGLLFASQVEADHGGGDPYHYSAWSTTAIGFSVAGQGWLAHAQFINSTNPDQARAYFCQQFGFFNCQVTGPTDTWVRSAGQCWSGAVGSSSQAIVTSAWSRTVASVTCPSNKPNLGTNWVQVASIPFEF
jgi:hypothetical protein